MCRIYTWNFIVALFLIATVLKKVVCKVKDEQAIYYYT